MRLKGLLGNYKKYGTLSMYILDCNFLYSWPLKGINTDDYLNHGPRSLFLALKPNTSLVFAVEQLAYILEKEEAKTIIKVGLEKSQIIDVLRKETGITERVCY